MRENTERRESKSPGRALWGWINTTPPRIREGATIHQPPRSCVSFSQLHFDNDIYLKPNPPTLFLPSSFLATASVVPRGWCTHQPPFWRGRRLGARDELNYTRSKFNIPFSFPLRQLSHCSVTRRFDHFSWPPILAAGQTCANSFGFLDLSVDQLLTRLLFGKFFFFFFLSLGRVERKRFEREKRL